MSDDDETTYSVIRTILGATHRRERWHLTDEVDVLTALGRSTFDLRSVETTGRDVVEMSVTCLLGSVRLLVPRGTMVVLDGTSFLASAGSVVEPGDDSDLPRIEVTATTVLGKVKILSAHDPVDVGATVPAAEAAPPAAADAAPPASAEVDAPASAEAVTPGAAEADAPASADDATPLAS